MKLTFPLQILCLQGVAFEGDVESVYLSGYEGEFELLPLHYPLLAALPQGEVKIANHASVPISVGVLLFRNNSCRIIAEVPETYKLQATWEGMEDD